MQFESQKKQKICETQKNEQTQMIQKYRISGKKEIVTMRIRYPMINRQFAREKRIGCIKNKANKPSKAPPKTHHWNNNP